MSRKRVAKVRVEMIKEKSVYCKTQVLDTPERAAEFARSLYYEMSGDEIRCMTKECLVVCSVDAKGTPLIVEYVSVGTSNSALVGIKEIFMAAILSNADGIFVFHNHPSGDPLPSMADQLMTKKIEEAAKLLDIPMRDHIILGDDGFYSYHEKRVTRWENANLKEVS